MADIDTIVAGAGVVGIAIARELALSGRSVIVLESAASSGTGTSSRNSEVIHAGLYYPTGSLKARLCLEGRERLYAFCESHGVVHRRCGKLIVACTDEETHLLGTLRDKGIANGCHDLTMLGGSDAMAMEPELSCKSALFSPSTGIIDSHGYMLALLGDAQEAGASFAFNTPLESVRVTDDGFVATAGGAEPMELTCATLINSAGLYAPALASRIEGLDCRFIPQAYYAKGSYFSLVGRAPFSRLIYPAPHTHGLGVHLTFDMGGQARFGPDIEWVDSIDYEVDPRRSGGFTGAIRRYWPGLPDHALSPAYSGIRPKISGPDEAAADFRIDGPEFHGISGLINLFGIESPGLTSSLAIASGTARLLQA